jgi:hypothetical protein
MGVLDPIKVKAGDVCSCGRVMIPVLKHQAKVSLIIDCTRDELQVILTVFGI